MSNKLEHCRLTVRPARLVRGTLGAIGAFGMLAACSVQSLAQQVPAGALQLRPAFSAAGTGSSSTQAGLAQVDDPFAEGSIGDGGVEDGSSIPDDQNAESLTGSSISTEAGDDAQGRAQRAASEGRVVDDINTGTPDSRANVRQSAVEAGNGRPERGEPFLPEGFRAGTWRVFTRIEQAAGYATNADFAPGGSAGAFSQTDVNIRAVSDWSRHQAEITADGGLRRSFTNDEGFIPNAAVNGSLRLDLIDGYTATMRGGYAYSTEALTSNTLGSNVSERPGVHAWNASAEAARNGGKLDLLLRGSLDRTTYEAATLDGGGTLNQGDRDNTLYQVTTRAAYGQSPALKPFVQAGFGWRRYDEASDRNGNERDSTVLDLRAGIQFDRGEKLNGEFAIGYLAESYRDNALETLDGVSFNSVLNWSPERDTTISFTSATTLGGSTTADVSGSIIHSLGVRAERRVRDNLALNATAGAELTYEGGTGSPDTTLRAGIGLEYWFSRYLSMTADLEHQRFESVTPANNWDSTSVRLGVAVQR